MFNQNVFIGIIIGTTALGRIEIEMFYDIININILNCGEP